VRGERGEREGVKECEERMEKACEERGVREEVEECEERVEKACEEREDEREEVEECEERVEKACEERVESEEGVEKACEERGVRERRWGSVSWIAPYLSHVVSEEVQYGSG
jgi:hypothetical protein